MTFFDERIADFTKLLEFHFPDLDNRSARKLAHELDRSLSSAGALQIIERSNTDPRNDKANLAKAAKALSSALVYLEKVGWHGQGTFTEVLKPFVDERDYQFLINSGSRSTAKDKLLERVEKLAEGLARAKEAVDLNGVSVMTAFDDHHDPYEFKRTKNTETQAMYVAKKCGELYYRITGTAPTVPNRQVPFGSSGTKNEAYGPFLDLVTAAFDAAKIQASPEAWAKRAVREFSPENKY